MNPNKYINGENTQLHIVQKEKTDGFQLMMKLEVQNKDVYLISRKVYSKKEMDQIWPLVNDEFAQACKVSRESVVPLIEIINFYKFNIVGKALINVNELNTHPYLH